MVTCFLLVKLILVIVIGSALPWTTIPLFFKVAIDGKFCLILAVAAPAGLIKRLPEVVVIFDVVLVAATDFSGCRWLVFR